MILSKLFSFYILIMFTQIKQGISDILYAGSSSHHSLSSPTSNVLRRGSPNIFCITTTL
jgi:hypothetical protein